MARIAVLVLLALTSAALLRGQGVAPYQTDFPVDEFVGRRAKVIDAIGNQALAIVQGAPGVDGFKVFRQSNEFYYLTGLEYRQAFFRYIRPGVTPDEVLALARRDMEGVLAKTRFASASHRQAAEEMLTFRGHLQHPVGMTVHDPGAIWGKPFQEGVVFTVDPMMWIPDEKLYVRMEDTIVVTKDGIENFTSDLASTPEEIEAVMRQDGILTRVPRLP